MEKFWFFLFHPGLRWLDVPCLALVLLSCLEIGTSFSCSRTLLGERERERGRAGERGSLFKIVKNKLIWISVAWLLINMISGYFYITIEFRYASRYKTAFCAFEISYRNWICLEVNEINARNVFAILDVFIFMFYFKHQYIAGWNTRLLVVVFFFLMRKAKWADGEQGCAIFALRRHVSD